MDSEVNVWTGLKTISNINNSSYHSVKRKIACTVELLGVYHCTLFMFGIVIRNGKINNQPVFPYYLSVSYDYDTNLFISDSNTENIFEAINEELNKVATCFKANKLSLNIPYFILKEKENIYRIVYLYCNS